MERMISFCGLLTMLAIAWLLSERRGKMNFRLIASGVGLQLLLAVPLLSITPLRDAIFGWVSQFMRGFIACSDRGAEFVFGEDFAEHYFALSVMPTVILFASLTAVLFHLGVLQWVVRIMARVMVWVMDVSGAESLCASLNVFVGMTTAPLGIKPYLATMTRSELMAMMTGGMATVSGGTMIAYVGLARQADGLSEELLAALPGHLMVASLISAPASLVIAKIMVPETQQSPTKSVVKVEVPRTDANLLDAACRGASDGMKLVLNIVAMLIVFIAMVHLINWGLSGLVNLVDDALFGLGIAEDDGFLLSRVLGGEHLTLERMLGWICAPLAWVMGIEWKDAHAVGVLLGEKTVFNEFIAYQSLVETEGLQPRSFSIATYALCGFANFGSIAVMIGGISGLAKDRRKDFARYGFRSMIGGALAGFMTACIAGMLI